MNVILIDKEADWLFIANSAIPGVFCFSPPVKLRDVPGIHVTVTKLARAMNSSIGTLKN